MEEAIVHPRVQERHPEISEQDVLDAWVSCIRAVPRLDQNPNEYIALGCDSKGRLLEMIALRGSGGILSVYHAKTPPTRKALIELGMIRK